VRATNHSSLWLPPEPALAFLLHFLSFVVFTSGLAWIATLIGLGQVWVLIGALLLLGLGLFTAPVRSREPEAS